MEGTACRPIINFSRRSAGTVVLILSFHSFLPVGERKVMRISIELFLLDNFVMNLLGLKLGTALRGERGRREPLCALLGAVWSLLALSLWPELLTIWGRLLCLGLMTLLTTRRGRYPLTLLSLLCAFMLLGGGLLLLQILLGIPIQSDGVLISTVPVRLALYGAAGGLGLVRLVKSLIRRGFWEGQQVDILLKLGEKTYACRGFVDTGNLLCEPLSGLPVVLGEGLAVEEGIPVVVDGWGEVLVERGEVYAPALGAGAIEVYAGAAPMELEKGQAIVPGWALPAGRKERRVWYESIQTAVAKVFKAVHKVAPAPVPKVGKPTAEPPVVSQNGGEPASTLDSGGGDALRPAVPHPGVGTKQAH